MIQIKRINNEDGMHYYKFDIDFDTHNKLINFLTHIDFQHDELIKIDTPFSELEGEYFHVKKEGMKIHFFIFNKEVNMVIDTERSQENLSNLMSNYFEFPSG